MTAKLTASERLAELVLSMDLVTGKGLRARQLARDVLQQESAQRSALRLIAHATNPSPDDGSGHEDAYMIATNALKEPT